MGVMQTSRDRLPERETRLLRGDQADYFRPARSHVDDPIHSSLATFSDVVKERRLDQFGVRFAPLHEPMRGTRRMPDVPWFLGLKQS